VRRVENAAQFRTRLERIARRWADAQRQLEAADSLYRKQYGEGRLEAVVRCYCVDHLLTALNWRVPTQLDELEPNVTFEQAVAYIGDDSEGAKATTRFMDYVGHDPEGCRALLVVEAKRPGHRLPGRSTAVATRLKSGLASSAFDSGPWRCLRQLGEYVESVARKQGTPPQRAAVTNGKWLVLFRNPTLAFCDAGRAEVSTDDLSRTITVFPDLLRFERGECDCDSTYAVPLDEAESLYESLEYHRVAGRCPALTLGALQASLAADEVRRAMYGTRVACSQITSNVATHPLLRETRACAVVFLETSGGAWARVFDDANEIRLSQSH